MGASRADRPTILKISADHVRIQIKNGISSEGAGEEILVRFLLIWAATPSASPWLHVSTGPPAGC